MKKRDRKTQAELAGNYARMQLWNNKVPKVRNLKLPDKDDMIGFRKEKMTLEEYTVLKLKSAEKGGLTFKRNQL